jgi:DNA-binding MarR family transcriptional regulator
LAHKKMRRPAQPAIDLAGHGPDAVDRLIEHWSRERGDLGFDWLRVVTRTRLIARHLRVDVLNALPETACSNPEFEVVIQLRSAGAPYALRPTDLFQALSLTSGAMTGRVDRLLALGWVVREPSASDRRATWIRLTQAGVDVSDRLVEYGYRHSSLARALNTLTLSEREDFVRLLGKLHRNLVV